VLHGDGGGKAGAIVEPLAGRQRVIRLLVGLLRRVRDFGVSIRLAWVNGQPGAVFYDPEGRVVSVVELDIADGVVQTIRSVVNPDKLGHIGPVSDVARLPRRELARGVPAAPHGPGSAPGDRQPPRHCDTDEGGNR
jgi:RNA polymerase sigma-70 factor (ECF subfamily)